MADTALEEKGIQWLDAEGKRQQRVRTWTLCLMPSRMLLDPLGELLSCCLFGLANELALDDRGTESN